MLTFPFLYGRISKVVQYAHRKPLLGIRTLRPILKSKVRLYYIRRTKK